jgi:hypothetical protein
MLGEPITISVSSVSLWFFVFAIATQMALQDFQATSS